MARSLVFMIDVEPDGRGDVHDDPWAGTYIALPALASWRERWRAITGAEVHFNWFPRFDPQMERTFGRTAWLARFPELLPTLAEHGDLAGVHVHFWRWHDGRGAWYNEFSDATWMRHCIDQSVSTFAEVFGAPPIAARFGDRWFSDEVLAMLCDAGVQFDLSLEPGLPSRPITDDWHATAPVPDTRRASRTPYVFRAPSGSLWVVPTTMSRQDYWLPQRSFPFLRRASQPFNLVLRPKILWRHLSEELERETIEPLVFVVRSGDLAKPRSREAFEFIAEQMSRHTRLPGCRFLRADDAVAQYHAAVETAV